MCIKSVYIQATRALTYDLDDLCQQNPVSNVLCQVLDKPRAAGLGQVVIGPIRVNLEGRENHINKATGCTS